MKPDVLQPPMSRDESWQGLNPTLWGDEFCYHIYGGSEANNSDPQKILDTILGCPITKEASRRIQIYRNDHTQQESNLPPDLRRLIELHPKVGSKLPVGDIFTVSTGKDYCFSRRKTEYMRDFQKLYKLYKQEVDFNASAQRKLHYRMLFLDQIDVIAPGLREALGIHDADFAVDELICPIRYVQFADEMFIGSSSASIRMKNHVFIHPSGAPSTELSINIRDEAAPHRIIASLSTYCLETILQSYFNYRY